MARFSIVFCLAALACASEESRQAFSERSGTAVHDGNFAARLPAHFAFLQSEHWFGIPANDPQPPPGIDPGYANWGLGTDPATVCVTSDPTRCVATPFGQQRNVASRYHPLAGIYSAAGGTASGQISAESLARIDLMLSLVRRPCDQGARVDGFAVQLDGTSFTSLHPANTRARAPEIALQAVEHMLAEAAKNGMSPVLIGDDPTWYWNVGTPAKLIDCTNNRSSCVAAVQQDVVDMVTMAKNSTAAVKVGGLPVLWFFSDGGNPNTTEWPGILDGARAQVGDFYAIVSLLAQKDNAGFYGIFDALSPWISLGDWNTSKGNTTNVHDHAVAYAKQIHAPMLAAVPAGKIVIGSAGPGFDDFSESHGNPSAGKACVDRQIPSLPEANPRDPGVLNGMIDYLATANDPRLRGVILTTWDDWNEGSHLEPSVEEGTSKLELLRDKLQVLFGDPADNGDLALRQRWMNYGQARTCNFSVPVVPPPATVLACTPPTASFTFTCGGRTCNFNGSGSTAGNGGQISTYAWTFGDGTSGTGATAAHTYAVNNTYTVTLTVTDAAGQTGRTSQSVQAIDRAPIASFSFGCTGATCTFDAETSSADSGIANYAWTFGDGQAVSGGSGAQTVTHVYGHFGSFTVGLTVTDNNGRTGSVTQTATVTPGPIAAFTFNCSGLTCSVDATGSSSNVGIMFYDWWWDDETTTRSTTATPPPHTYAFGSTFNVALTVTDKNNKTASVTHALTVIDPNPVVAVFSASCTGLTCTFDPAGSASNTGIKMYHWWFDDETTTDTFDQSKVPHTYASTGTFLVSLTVTDDNGKTGTVTHPVTVADPVAVFTFNCTGLTCTFNPAGSLSKAGIQTYHWWWDDETTNDFTTNDTRTHTYAFAGTFNVSLTVIDNNQNTGTVTHAVSVSSTTPGPSAVFTVSCSGMTCTVDPTGSSSNANITDYFWWWDDEMTTEVKSSTPQQQTHTYTFGATFNISLTITDSNQQTSTATHPVTIAAPGNGLAATFTFNCTGLTCTFNASGSTPGMSYLWWWDDESTSKPTDPTVPISHTYAFGDVFNVSLTVSDSSGNTATVTHSVSVVNPAAGPTAAFVFGCKGRTCTFDGSGSASGVPIVHYHWWWDDETTADLTGATAQHVYGFGATFNVSLTVTDASGQTATVTHAVTTQ